MKTDTFYDTNQLLMLIQMIFNLLMVFFILCSISFINLKVYIGNKFISIYLHRYECLYHDNSYIDVHMNHKDIIYESDIFSSIRSIPKFNMNTKERRLLLKIEAITS